MIACVHGSLPARGVWIEILRSWRMALYAVSLPARGVWIEIYVVSLKINLSICRSPQGECGLKFVGFPIDAEQALSLPARGVWIEI